MPTEEQTYRKSVTDSLGRIEMQVSKTNGRVTKLERNLLIVGTAVLVIIALKFPELLTVAKVVL